MFVGRERELSTLNRLYQSDRFEFAVIYGRRRVGKTAIIKELIRDKEAIYFTGVESNAKQNLENLSSSILTYMTNMETGAGFSSFQAAIESVFQQSEHKRMILAMDEYPYAARAEKSLASTLQMLIDRYKDTSKLLLILCGSSMSYMEDHVLAYKSPLYGRRTAQLKIEPFTFFEARPYLKDFSLYDKALAYGIVGGTPQYLLQLDAHKSIEDNIKDIYFDPSSALYEEPSNLLKQEMREPATYNAIISAVASGAAKLSEIAGKSGVESSVCATYIKNLIGLGIVKKELPYGENVSRKTLYFIADNMFRFWYRFVPDNSSIIQRGAKDIAYRRTAPYLSDYMGTVFEEICKQYLWELLLANRCNVVFSDLGRWWGTNPKTRQQEEIDIMGIADKHSILLGECKWTNEKVDLPILERLLDRGTLFAYRDKQYYLFSKSGFTKGCEERAAQLENMILVPYAEMLEI